MESKKKPPAKKTGKKQFRNYAVLGGVSVAEMTREQLEDHINQLQLEVEKEKEDRNYFQMERDRIQLFWEVTKQQLEEKDAMLRLKDSEIDEAALTNLAEIKLYKQKMKHVMFECQQHINEKMKEKMGEKIMAEEEHEMQIHHLESEINKLNDEILQLKIDHDDEIISQRLNHGEELCSLHQKYHTEMDIAKSKSIYEIQNIRNELDLQKEKAIQEIEERKDAHVEHLIQAHQELFKCMKNFYNDIIKNDILLIKSLKDQIQNYQRKEQHVKENMHDLKLKNENLQKVLTEMQQKYESRNGLKSSSNTQHLEMGSILRNLKRENQKLKSESDALFSKLLQMENASKVQLKYETSSKNVKT